MDEKGRASEVRTSHGAVIELWLSGKAEEEKILQAMTLVTRGNTSQRMSFWTPLDPVQPKVIQIDGNKSEVIAISPTNVCLYEDKLRYLCQAFAILHFPSVGDYNVRIRLAGRVSHTFSSQFYVGNRLIIPYEGDQMVRLPQLKVKIACWPIGTEAPNDELAHIWRAVEKYPADMPISRLFASANLLVALLKPNCALIGCVSSSKESIGVLADISNAVQSIQMRTIEAGVEPAKAWLHKGEVMEERQIVGRYSNGPIIECECAYESDTVLLIEDLQGNTAALACPGSVNGAYLYRKVADIRASWLHIQAFFVQGEVYSASSYTAFEVWDGCRVLLFNQGDYAVPVRNSNTGDQFSIILKSPLRKGKDLKSAFAKATPFPIPPKFTFTGKLMNSYNIGQYSIRNTAELLIICKNKPLLPCSQVRVQLSTSPPFLSVLVDIRCTFISLKDQLCQQFAVTKGAARMISNEKEAEDQKRVTEQRGNLLFLRPEERAIWVKIENRSILVPINGRFTVLSLKSALETITGFTAAHMSLYFNGNPLEDGKTMEELNIKHLDELETRFCSELEVLVMPSRGTIYSISTSSTATISSFKHQIAISQGTSHRLMHRGEELEDSRLVSDYGLRTWAVVTAIDPDFLNLLVKTPGQGSFLDLVVHPSTKIRKIKAKIGKMWGILQGDFDLILTKEVQNEDILHPFLFKSTKLQPSISFR